jgi:NUMOD4 motif/HNH endonuclease
MEYWKEVIGWEDSHLISNLGQVKSVKRKGSKNIILKQQKTQGYPSVILVAFGKKQFFYVHHLVAFAFIGQPPGKLGTKKGEFTINHKDCDKANNKVANLEWLTCTENYIHGFENGRLEIKKGTELSFTKLTPEKVLKIKQRIANGDKPIDIANDFNVVKGTIYAIKNGLSWKGAF